MFHNETCVNPVRTRRDSTLSVTRSLIHLGLELQGAAGVRVLVLVSISTRLISVLSDLPAADLSNSHSVACLLLQILFKQASTW